MDAITPSGDAARPSERRPMDTGALKRFAQEARRALREQVTAKLGLVLNKDSAARRELPKAVLELEGEIHRTSHDQVIERVAYTWFNRFTALCFMDANGYTAVRVVTSGEGQARPEILAEAMAGVIGDEVPQATASQVRALLDGRAPSHDPQGEAYRMLVVAACNHWNGAMPFLFEPIADYTELLMPEDLLSQSSILAHLREVMTEDACHDVEIIGWLYQFYISEKKDQVFAALKKNVKITPENIPAATQLFTPHWIVRYLVENSLGRLWMLNRPESKLAVQMDYYIAPEEPETDFLRVTRPEEIRICDPACGSGHMLTYAFDLLYAIYEEEGYDPIEIPAKILTHNLYGIEIDDRAGALAAFALVMKAAARLGRRRFLRMPVLPNICVLQNFTFTDFEMKDVAAVVGRDLFTDELCETLLQFEQAKNFGSLIVPKLRDPAESLRVVEARDFASDLLLKDVQHRVLTVLRMAEFLSPKYHVVVANPPYMGSSGMNSPLKAWADKNYPDSKSDLFGMFMERTLAMNLALGMMAMINLPSWMFLSSFEKLRLKLLGGKQITSLLQCGRGLFGSDFGAVAFSIRNSSPQKNELGTYRRLFEKHVDVRKPEVIRDLFLNKQYGHFLASTRNFAKIPGSPIAYWVSDGVLKAFVDGNALETLAPTRKGMVTARNHVYVRNWHEVSHDRSGLDKFADRESARISEKKWFSYLKGGGFRKWYGNKFEIVNWEKDGRALQTIMHPSENRVWATNFNLDYIFKKNVNWGAVTSAEFSARISEGGELFDAGGSACFPQNIDFEAILGFLNSKITSALLKVLNPTLNFQAGNISNLPILSNLPHERIVKISNRNIALAKSDWDAYETSWDFTTLPLLTDENRAETLEGTYARLRTHWRKQTQEMQRLEEENNRVFIDAYGLQDELTPEVSPEEVTLTCNPAYRYGGKRREAELEALLLADTMREFLSYTVGCMFGRYSLDAPGLILANLGDGAAEYLAKIPNPTFEPDPHNVIPILDGDWFADDITERFRRFLRVAFGEEHFQANLAFVEAALGKDIRKYFVRDFFNDHVKCYKKRPIYWLFSSPKGTFNAIIYMHRYRPDTVSVVLNDYLREFRSKLEGHRRAQEALSISGDASAGQKARALKEIEATSRQIEEIDAWERDVLFPLATQRIEIDLDDGVRANYPKLGTALKPIKGLNDADE